MSSGFRASYSILIGLIKEIEFRGLGSARDFSGLIIIDELDLHLHPSWQGRIPRVLKDVFPQAQIIASTHSPHMIQEAYVSELIVLESGSQSPRKIEHVDSEYGFVGWTIEEILQDVMGLADVRPKQFRDALRAFDDAVDADNHAKAKRAQAVLLKMLHPANPLRQIIKLDWSE